MSKTHYASCDRANESDPEDYWGKTLCGLEYTESPMSDRIEYVTCKNCLNRHRSFFLNKPIINPSLPEEWKDFITR
jgi:hypothetical protein